MRLIHRLLKQQPLLADRVSSAVAMPTHDLPSPDSLKRGPLSQKLLLAGVIFIFLILALSACSSANPAAIEVVQAAPSTPDFFEIPSQNEAQQEINPPLPTAVLEQPVSVAPEVEEQGLNLEASLSPEIPQPALEPLRFVFPSPRQAPVSALRPPLYPIPWSPTPFDHFYFSRPIAADEINWPLWDYRYGGNFFENVIHTGIDIPTPVGAPVLAAGPGKVIWAGYGLFMGNNDPKDPYGLAITILHDFSYQDERLYTVYAHLSQIDVVRGQRVETGEVIGLTGATGHVTGPHLHFEVRMGKNDFFTTRNPELWLVPPEGWGVLVGRIQTAWGNPIPHQTVIVHSKSTRQKWEAKSYGLGSVNSDSVYQENLVISDLPAGTYEVKIPYLGYDYTHDIEIHAGLVTFVTFKGWHGFFFDPPVPPGADFNPE
jgi:murein DD-endopeptidase MepM/ murein hydrolase activator NlpD